MIMLVQNDECFVHAAVIAVGEDQDLAAPGDQAGEPDRPPIRVRRRERGRPAWQAETATELSADPLGVFGGQHRGDATAFHGTRSNRTKYRWWRMPSHRTGVAQSEVGLSVAVDGGEVRSGSRVQVQREAA
jgi:hypothetical protein